MKFDFKQDLTNLDGSPLETAVEACSVCGRGRDAITLTLMTVCGNALTAQFRDEQDLSGEEKVRRFRLAMEITNDIQIDLTPEDLVLIRKLVAKMYGPLVVGQAWGMLTPESEEG